MYCLVKISSSKNNYKYLLKLNNYLYSSILVNYDDTLLPIYIDKNKILVLNILIDKNYIDIIHKMKKIIPNNKVFYLILEYTSNKYLNKFIQEVKLNYNNIYGILIVNNNIFKYNINNNNYKIFKYKVKYNIKLDNL